MTENQDLRAVTVFVRELWNAGVRHVCISPGSRSTPLTMAMARHGRYHVWSLLDERSAGFFAVGLARRTGEPVALVCTSGTATGNYLPAMMEAHEARLPVIALTADRPPELHHAGSNQTVDQAKLYGSFAKWAAVMPVPEASDTILRHAAATAWRAAAVACASPAGPVHINWPFREPLIPPYDSPESDARTPVRHVFSGRVEPSEAAVEHLHQVMESAARPLIVCGPIQEPGFAEAVTKFASLWGCPILADPLSQLRTGPHDKTQVMDTYDIALRIPEVANNLAPDVVIRFGQTPTSKVLGQFLGRQTQARQVVVDDAELWRDPFHATTDVIQANPVRLCERLAEGVKEPQDRSWLDAWCDANRRLRASVAEILNDDAWFEGRIFVELTHLLPAGATLFAGNSMPVRDMDSFFLQRDDFVHVLSNRGVSGIDGVVSSAFGASAGNGGRTVLVIGDISFYHDMNGLLAAARLNLPLLIILVHNDGGGIFSFLPQAAHADTFEHFQTRHGVDFRAAVEMYGGHFERVNDWTQFRAAVTSGLDGPGLQVVELRTNGEDNVALHRAVFARAAEVLKGHPWLS